MTTTPAPAPRRAAHGRATAAVTRVFSDVGAARIVLAVSGVYAVAIGALAILRYVSFASDFDHGIFSQYVWLFGHFKEPFNTINLRFVLGDHVEPGLALLGPLGTLGVGAPGLLVVQALALAATAPLLYVLARLHGASRGLAVVGPLLWCASPVVLRVGLHDFHPESLVPVTFVAGAVALAKERTGWFVASAVLACSFKEDIALTYVALGLVLFSLGRRRLGAVLAVASAFWAVFAVYVVLPVFGNASEQEFGPRFAGARGDSVLDVVRFSILHPLTAVDQALTPNDLGVLAMMIATTGGLALLAPRWLAVAIPSALLNLLSAYDLQHTIDYHYWIVCAGVVAVGAAAGAGRVPAGGGTTWLRVATVAGVVLIALSLQWVRAITNQIRFEWPQRAEREEVLAAIPDDASVAAPMHALSHLSERTKLYVLPEPFLAVRVGTEWGALRRDRAVRELDYVVYDPGLRFWGSPSEAEVKAAIEMRGFREILRRGETRLYRPVAP